MRPWMVNYLKKSNHSEFVEKAFEVQSQIHKAGRLRRTKEIMESICRNKRTLKIYTFNWTMSISTYMKTGKIHPALSRSVKFLKHDFELPISNGLGGRNIFRVQSWQPLPGEDLANTVCGLWRCSGSVWSWQRVLIRTNLYIFAFLSRTYMEYYKT